VANSASSEKRARQNERNRLQNKARRSALKTETRKFVDAVHAGDAAKAKEEFVAVQRKLDQLAAKRTLHKNTASRRKSRLAKRLNALANAKSAGPARA
jgi:small subunit ribosomal protein S20